MTVDSPPSTAGGTANRGGLWQRIVNAEAETFLAPGLVVLVIVAALSAYLTLQSDQTAILGRSAGELRLINLELNNKISDAETSQRGFLLTSDPAYLAPYEEAARDIPELSRKLMDLTASDPQRQAMATRVKELAELKLGEIRKTVALQKGGDAAAAIAVVRQDVGKRYFDELRSILAQLTDQATDDVEERRDQLRAQRQWLMGATLAGLILSAVLSVIALTRTRRQIGELRERHRTLIDINEILEQRVTERTAELEQAKAETERERDQVKALLADVNHRIGNNLQLVSSMLGFHARFAAGEETRNTLQAARNQVQSIASAQRRLRLLGSSDEVELESFMSGLLEDLRDTLTANRPIKVELSSSSARVSSKTAVSIGVIVNELINNAVKHAFPDNLAGTVRVEIATGNTDRVEEIVVEDDGVGISPSIESEASGLGGKIVQALSHSLNASLNVEATHPGAARPGTRIRLTLAEMESAA
jgi:two-component sensor histidine kinase/CHASE3 domain sensor protein